ncbi:MAG: oligosaccharide flippase family protein, partial [bacterium]
MKQRLAKLKDSRYFRSSSIILIGAFFVNFLSYLFAIIVGRLLGPVNYGEVASIFGLAAIIGVPAGTVSMFMTKRVAGLAAKGEHSRLHRLYNYVVKNTFLFSLILMIVYFLLMPLVAQFLRLEYLPLVIFGLVIPITFLLSINLGSLQGLQDFVPFSYSNFWGALSKLILAVIFIFFGWSVWGVILALVLSNVVSELYSLTVIKKKILVANDSDDREIVITKRDILPYVSIAFWATLLLTVITNIDVILAKHYLPDELAGQYAALSVMGKIIIYGTGAFVTAMFPMVSASQSNGDGEGSKLLANSLMVVTALSGIAIVVFWFAPKLVISLLFGSKYFFAIPYLGLIGLAMFFIALTTAYV